MKLFCFIILLFITQHEAYCAVTIEHTSLENGMDVYVIENHHTPIITHMLLYNVGAVNDPENQSGLAHFLEHLMFRGTEKNNDISNIIHKNGGNFNASTSSYYTNYFETVPKEKLELMMELESDRMRNLIFTENAVIAERKIVAEERRMRVDNIPQNQLIEEMLSAFYRNNSAWQVAGWNRDILAFNKEKAEYLYDRFYHPNNAALLIVGDTTLSEAMPMINKHYGTIPCSKQTYTQEQYEPEHKANTTVTLKDPNVKQAEISIWYEAPNITNTEALPLKLASIILGEGRTSYFHKELVENDIATHVEAHYNPFVIGTSIFAINAISTTSPSNTTSKILKLIDTISANGITETDLHRAKKMLRTSLVYRSESTIEQAIFYGEMITSKANINTIEHLEEEIHKVTVSQVNEALLNILYKKDNTTIGYLTPMEILNEE